MSEAKELTNLINTLIDKRLSQAMGPGMAYGEVTAVTGGSDTAVTRCDVQLDGLSGTAYECSCLEHVVPHVGDYVLTLPINGFAGDRVILAVVKSAYVPGQLIEHAVAKDTYTAGAKTLDGAVYDAVYRFFDAAYDSCQLTVTLPVECVVRVEVLVESLSVSNIGGIGILWIADSLSDPTSVYGGDYYGWVTRDTNNHSGYSYVVATLAAGIHYFRPVWQIQDPYVFSMRFGAHINIMAWKAYD